MDESTPATVQIIDTMKQKNNGPLKRHDKEDLGFLDDRLQLLDTVRQMIDIELERRGASPDGDPHPEKPPPEQEGRNWPEAKTARPSDRPRRTLWQRIVSLFTTWL